jgi:hypothetical protein
MHVEPACSRRQILPPLSLRTGSSTLEYANMNKKLIGLVLLVVGVILLYFGWQGSESLGDQVTETVTGRFTDDTMFLIIVGAVAIAAGAFLSFARK